LGGAILFVLQKEKKKKSRCAPSLNCFWAIVKEKEKRGNPALPIASSSGV
jgi:hypothetical protein